MQLGSAWAAFTNPLFYCFALLFFPLGGESISIDLEHAITPQEREWGLMARPASSFPPGKGIIIHFPREGYWHVWMFGCLIDLSVAFLSDQFEILQIEELEAHPEWLDPLRPIHVPSDLTQYNLRYGPIARRFQRDGKRAKKRCRYLLEVPAGWFEEAGIKVGDRLLLPSPEAPQGIFEHREKGTFSLFSSPS